MKALLDNVPPKDRILTINCWNEWTEGSYLEPDTRQGMAYLEAVARVFRDAEKSTLKPVKCGHRL